MLQEAELWCHRRAWDVIACSHRLSAPLGRQHEAACGGMCSGRDHTCCYFRCCSLVPHLDPTCCSIASMVRDLGRSAPSGWATAVHGNLGVYATGSSRQGQVTPGRGWHGACLVGIASWKDCARGALLLQPRQSGLFQAAQFTYGQAQGAAPNALRQWASGEKRCSRFASRCSRVPAGCFSILQSECGVQFV